MTKRAYQLFWLLFWSIVCFWVITRFVFTVGEVQGDSMAPTLRDGDIILINKCILLFRNPTTNDIVMFRSIYATNGHDYSLKRVKYITEDGKYYLTGDNSVISYDSMMHGPVEKSQIVGLMMVQ